MITLNITPQRPSWAALSTLYPQDPAMFSDHQEGLGGVMFRVIIRRAFVA
jgi:hypothetical protein